MICQLFRGKKVDADFITTTATQKNYKINRIKNSLKI